jgi:predicted 3-demethylubiquinone-9 3-methyltransferase (glyoxalase superfamily)
MQKISPFLWFNDQAEEAVNFYCSVFKNSKITHTTRYDEASAQVSGRKAGSIMSIGFELEGQQFAALNGGPIFSFTPAISFVVDCASQEEVDYFWEKLSAKPEVEQCGWLQDPYGVSWQIVPSALYDYINGPDKEGAGRAMQAMLQMKKLDIAGLKRAYEGAS